MASVAGLAALAHNAKPRQAGIMTYTGATNSKGEHPHDRPLTPADLWATVYRHLGIDQNAAIDDHTGRPQHLLPSGTPIRELI